MEVFRKPLSTVFSSDRRYVIPLFQRPYVWTRELQWEPLWEDIVACADANLESGDEQPHIHFLGAIVIQQRPVWGDELLAHDVIDGQQRLTTFQILLAALRDIAKGHDDRPVTGWLESLTRNATAIANPDVEQFKVWPTARDVGQFRLVLTLGSLESIETVHPPVVKRRRLQPRPRMVEAYAYFHQAITEWLADASEDQVSNRLRVLRRVVDKHLQLVSIELDGNEDPQAIFETLNARGVPLLASDLLRNYIFQRARDDAHRLHELYWSRFEIPDDPRVPDGARFWEIEERQGRLYRARLDLLAQNYLAMKLGRDIASARLYPEYKQWIESKKPFATVEEELKDLSKYASYFEQLIFPHGDSALARFAQRMKVLDVGTAYPLVLALCGDANLDPVERAGIFIDLESFLVRRLVCGRTTKHYNKLFLQILREFQAQPVRDRASFRAVLGTSTAETADWPRDDDFRYFWSTVDAYRDLRSARVEMILRAIEDAARDSKSERITLHGDLTVEHVMPQTWKDHWPLPSEVDPDLAVAERDENLHDFGNLTLLTQPLNSSVSNAGASIKLPQIAAQSSLKINAYFQGRTTWNEDDIRHRGLELFKYAVVVWPGP